MLIPPLGKSSSPRFRVARASSRLAFRLLSVATLACRSAILVLTSSMARSSWNLAARTRPTLRAHLGLGGNQVGFRRRDRGLLDRELDLVGFLVELDEHAPLLHAHVVVDEHLNHLAGNPRRDKGHVAVDIGIVGGNRVECRLHSGGEQVTSVSKAAHDEHEENSLSPGVRSAFAVHFARRDARVVPLVPQPKRYRRWRQLCRARRAGFCPLELSEPGSTAFAMPLVP